MPRFALRVAAALVAAAASSSVAAASAATLAALQDGTTIVWIDTDLKRVVGSTRLASGGSLVAIDVRPADGRL